MECLFRFTYPRAVHVSLLGEFNRWSTTATPMRRREDGTWEASVELPPGRYGYCYFVVDGSDAPGEDGDAGCAAGARPDWLPAGGSCEESYLARLGIVNLGSELCVPSKGLAHQDHAELLN